MRYHVAYMPYAPGIKCSWDTSCAGSYTEDVDPKEKKIVELEKKVEALDVVNKPGVRWLKRGGQ